MRVFRRFRSVSHGDRHQKSMEIVQLLETAERSDQTDLTKAKNSHALRPAEAGLAAAALLTLGVAMAMVWRAGSAPLVPGKPCGIVLNGDECWDLSAPGESCVDHCGSESAVDAEATVRGSGRPEVQAALATLAVGRRLNPSGGLNTSFTSPSATANCGVADRHFPYGGMALLDESKQTWVCASAEEGGFRSVSSSSYRSPCVCAAVPVERPLVNAMEGITASLIVFGAVVLLAAAVDAVGRRRASSSGGDGKKAQIAASCATFTAAVIARDFSTALGLLAEFVGGSASGAPTTRLGGFDKVGLLVSSAAVTLDFYLGAICPPFDLCHSDVYQASVVPFESANSPIYVHVSTLFAPQMSLCSSSTTWMGCGATSSLRWRCCSSRRPPALSSLPATTYRTLTVRALSLVHHTHCARAFRLLGPPLL